MTRSRKIFFMSFSLLTIIFLILSASIVGRFTIKRVEVKDIPETWNVMSLLLREKGRNVLSLNKRGIKKEIEKLIYIERADVGVHDNVLTVTGILPQCGVLLYDGRRTAFVGECEKGEIDSRDYIALQGGFLTLEVTPVLFDIILGSNDEKYTSLMMTLSLAFESSGLITNAEYDNNKPSIFSGSLTLYLDSVEAVLIIKDLRKVDRLEECLEIIKEDYISSNDRMLERAKEYVLDDSLMVVKR